MMRRDRYPCEGLNADGSKSQRFAIKDINIPETKPSNYGMHRKSTFNPPISYTDISRNNNQMNYHVLVRYVHEWILVLTPGYAMSDHRSEGFITSFSIGNQRTTAGWG